MATPDPLLVFFTRMKDQGGIIVKDQPKLDLDLYIQNYRGQTRFERLLHLGKTCVPLCVEAIKGAVAEAKEGVDTDRYEEAWDCLRLAAPHEPDAEKDHAWIAKTQQHNSAKTTRLETELKGYKNNLVKESIRMGNEDLGKHFEEIGDFSEAAKAYGRMRSDATTTKYIIDSGMHLINVSLQRRDWGMVLGNLEKVTGVQSSEDDKFPQTYIKIVSGIARLGLGQYLEAASSFLKMDFKVPSTEYNHIVSPNDIAVYGGLTALATMERQELQTKVLDNQSFRTFLEHEPHIRKAISLFVNGRYAQCLAVLESYRNDFLLDLYLQRHVSTIFSLIRNKCITQYFVPFSCVTLDNLETAFAQSKESLLEELVVMIREGNLKARIDAKNNLLVAINPDPRLKLQVDALDTAQRFEAEAKERLRRMNIVGAGLEVAGHGKQGFGQSSRSEYNEDWHGEAKNLSSYFPSRMET